MATTATASPLAVARYILQLAAAEDEEPELVSNMRLQKLLYYTQGWSLAERDRPMFNSAIEAWKYGPVVVEVYNALKGRGSEPIKADDIEIPENADLCSEDKEFVRQVWDTYKGFSAFRLSEMTHAETPWKKAREHTPNGAWSRADIEPDWMKDYFRSLGDG